MATALAEKPEYTTTADAGAAPIGSTKKSTETSPPAFTDSDKRWLKELGITTADPGAFQKAWAPDAERYRRASWRESVGGRLAIRAASRGLLGATTFALGQMLESHWFHGYNPDLKFGELKRNPLQYGAWILDKTIGKAIYFGAYGVNRLAQKSVSDAKENAESAITFRDTRQYVGYNQNVLNGTPAKKGRSYGHESLAITFDFGMASLGDYTGREIANLLDPNVEKTWIQNGKIDYKGAFKAFGGHVWTAFTRAMGEDYAAMLMGYPYVVRLSRHVINTFSPGFKYDSDYALNGGSFKVNDAGQIKGNYQIEGMADLGFRFTVYNIFTKMYRDFYDNWLAVKAKKLWGGSQASETEELAGKAKRSFFGAIADSVRYVVRTSVKMTLIMVPSTFFFYITRSPQSKDIGLAINNNLVDPNNNSGKVKGPIGGIMSTDGLFHAIHATGAVKGKRSGLDDISNISFQEAPGIAPERVVFAADKARGYETRFDPFSMKNNNVEDYAPEIQGKKHVVWHDYITNPIGILSYQSSKVLTEILKPAARGVNSNVSISRLADFSRKAFYASYAYAPYFAVKTDILTEKWDNARTDAGIDRAISGLVRFNFGEFKAGVGETMRSLQGRPFADLERERMIQEKMRSHRDQIWGEPEDKTIAQRESETIAREGRSFAAEELKKQPLTQLIQRNTADTTWKERATRQFDNMTLQGQSLH